MRLLVTGTRRYSDREFLYHVLDQLDPLVVIEGAAKGADQLAHEWAVENAGERNVTNLRFPADWKRFGRAAGPVRNKRMLVEGKPTLVVAFPEPGGKGTQNMMRQALKAGLTVLDATGCGGVEGAKDIRRMHWWVDMED